MKFNRDISPPLREMIKLMPPPSLARHEAEPVRRIPCPPGLDAQGEGRRFRPPANHGPVHTPIVGTSFEGLGAGQYGFTVNKLLHRTQMVQSAQTQYVQWVNQSFAIF